jgi:hypothetical protein
MRAILAVAVASVLIAWMAVAAGLSWSVGRTPASQLDSAPVAHAQTALEQEAVHLRDRSVVKPVPASSRNPFRYATPVPVATTPSKPSSVVSAMVQPLADAARSALTAVAERPALHLVGVAETRTPDGKITRTAIVSGLRQLFLVKEGEAVAGRFKVGRIGAQAIDLVDLIDGSSTTITLR